MVNIKIFRAVGNLKFKIANQRLFMILKPRSFKITSCFQLLYLIHSINQLQSFIIFKVGHIILFSVLKADSSNLNTTFQHNYFAVY